MGQVAAASVLLVWALWLGRSFSALWNTDRGYDPTNLLTVSLTLPDPTFTPETRAESLRQLLKRSEVLPGVVSAGFSTIIPMSNADALMGFSLPPRGDSPTRFRRRRPLGPSVPVSSPRWGLRWLPVDRIPRLIRRRLPLS